MGRRRILWHLYPTYLLVTLIALVAVTLLATRTVYRFYTDETGRDLQARAMLIRERIASELARPESIGMSGLDRLCKELGSEASARITIILPSGEVMGDSEEDIARMGPHLGTDRPEILTALNGAVGRSIRYSRTLQRSMLYVAVPLTDATGSPPIGVVRVSLPLTSMRDALRTTYVKIGLGALLVALVCALASLVLSRRISRPLETLRRGAEAFARGDLDRRLSTAAAEEIDVLASSMNRMAGQLHDRIATITQQRNEQEAILQSMVEGVLAVDAGGRIVTMNDTLGTMFRVNPKQAVGHSVQEVLRVPDLQRLVDNMLSGGRSPQEGDVILREREERHFQVHCAPLRTGEGTHAGAVLVVNDVTRLRRLEGIRRDFVANVSHELKTPITSIKGAVETLQDGAWREAQDAPRFLDMISRHSSRLEAIIEDLLRLSRIEQGAESAEMSFRSCELQPVLASAVRACEASAAARDIRLRLIDAPGETPEAWINAALIENAVVNLIDNALKYSDAGTQVEVALASGVNGLAISVRDEGCGIAEDDQERIFERFYRVDKSRSEAAGSTGLGLAIVKHIAQAHGGRVSVDSSPGEGSVFRLNLPIGAPTDHTES